MLLTTLLQFELIWLKPLFTIKTYRRKIKSRNALINRAVENYPKYFFKLLKLFRSLPKKVKLGNFYSRQGIIIRKESFASRKF